MTVDAQPEKLVLGESQYILVDTPGLFDTKYPNEQILEKLGAVIGQCAYGIQAMIFSIGRYTLIQFMLELFGLQISELTCTLHCIHPRRVRKIHRRAD